MRGHIGCVALKKGTMVPLLIFTIFISNVSSEIPVASTSSGIVIGTKEYFEETPTNVFLGVPYAQPPIGELRFQKTQPLDTPTTIRYANFRPPACIQYAQVQFPWVDMEPGRSEDCLYLNIWSPVTNCTCEKKAVMFFIHGGSFLTGSNRKDLYNGEALATRGNVVVVVINYRLGPFGFLTSGTDAAPGNAGMYDVVEALNWVNRNIEQFGGDSKKITVFGESAGSITAGMLCVSPLSQGLFKRVIMESGAPTCLFEEGNTANLKVSQKLAKAVGCASDFYTIQDNSEAVVACLKGINAEELSRTLNSFDPFALQFFTPNYGDSFLPQEARIAIMNFDFQNVDLMIGDNRDEGSFALALTFHEVFGVFGEKNSQINKTFGEKMIRTIFSSFPNKEAVVEIYLGNVQETDYDTVRRQVYAAFEDFALVCPGVYFAERFADKGNRVYFYNFVHRSSNTPWAPWMGVAHFEEVQLVFGKPLRYPSQYTGQEYKLSEDMINIWTTFAKTGYPDSTENRPWAFYSRGNPELTYLDTANGINGQIGYGPHLDKCNFFRPYFGFY